jgi:hypothetical protein
MMPVSVLETQVLGTWGFPIHAATTSALDRQLEPETITEPNVDHRGMGEINWRPRASALQQSWAQMLI